MLVHRVQAAYDAVRRSARFWPGFDKTEVKAMLIYDARGEPYARIRKVDGWLGRIGWRDFDADTRHPRSEPMMIMQELATAKENHRGVASTEDWIGVYVHECFHVFQHDFSDVRKAQKIGVDESGDRGVLEKLATSEAFEDPTLAADPLARQYVSPQAAARGTRKTLRRTLSYRGVGNYFYTIGELVSRLLDAADEGWKQKVFDRGTLLIGAVGALPE